MANTTGNTMLFIGKTEEIKDAEIAEVSKQAKDFPVFASRFMFWHAYRERLSLWNASASAVDAPGVKECIKELDSLETLFGENNNALCDALETAAFNAVVTEGTGIDRKRFWNFVEMRIAGIVPSDLLVPVNAVARQAQELEEWKGIEEAALKLLPHKQITALRSAERELTQREGPYSAWYAAVLRKQASAYLQADHSPEAVCKPTYDRRWILLGKPQYKGDASCKSLTYWRQYGIINMRKSVPEAGVNVGNSAVVQLSEPVLKGTYNEKRAALFDKAMHCLSVWPVASQPRLEMMAECFVDTITSSQSDESLDRMELALLGKITTAGKANSRWAFWESVNWILSGVKTIDEVKGWDSKYSPVVKSSAEKFILSGRYAFDDMCKVIAYGRGGLTEPVPENHPSTNEFGYRKVGVWYERGML